MQRLWVLALVLGCAAQSPAAVYDGGFGKFNATIELRIGNGGAGQSGLVKGTALRRLEKQTRILIQHIANQPSQTHTFRTESRTAIRRSA